VTLRILDRFQNKGEKMYVKEDILYRTEKYGAGTRI
jgi:hypothetical protein